MKFVIRWSPQGNTVKLPNQIEFASVTGHLEVNMLKHYYNITAEELAAKLA